MRRTPGSKAFLFLLLPLLTGGLIAVGCGDDGGTTAADGETTTTAGAEAEGEAPGEASEGKPKPPPNPDGKAITTAGSQFGEVLFDSSDRAIYVFDLEQSSKSECYEECAVEWPPVLTKGDPVAKGDVEQGRLGTTKRDDGSLQVTYEGQPLYYYHDEPRGEVLCHNVPGFGGLWLAIDASGKPV